MVDAFRLYSVFRASNLEAKQMVLKQLASSVDEPTFDKLCIEARDMASDTDFLNGYKPTQSKRGFVFHGPERRKLNSRLHEAQRVFHVFRENPTFDGNFFQALKVSKLTCNEDKARKLEIFLHNCSLESLFSIQSFLHDVILIKKLEGMK